MPATASRRRSSAPLRIPTRQRGAHWNGSRSNSQPRFAVRGSQRAVQQKRGRPSPPFLAGEAAYRFLPPFFFPPLALFFAIALYPSLRSWDLRGSSPHSSAAAFLARQPVLRRPSLRWINSRRSLREVRMRKNLLPKKTRGCQLTTPPDRLGGCLAFLPALFLAALRSLLRHYSSLECGCSAVLTGSRGLQQVG